MEGTDQVTVDWFRLAGVAAASDTRVTVNAPSEAALLSDLERRLGEGRGFAVATLNLDHVVKLRRDPAFRTAYAAMSHVTADGNPIVWLQRLAGQPVDLVPGSQLIAPVAALAARRGVPVALFGATEASLDGAEQSLLQANPGLRVACRIAPPMGFDPEGEAAGDMIREIEASGARIVFLALGAPKQEYLAARIARDAPGLGTLSIGAGLDFLSGAQVRAPAWARALALEWLWRLTRSPRRLWQRYRDCFAVLPGLTVRALRARQAGAP